MSICTFLKKYFAYYLSKNIKLFLLMPFFLRFQKCLIFADKKIKISKESLLIDL